MHGDILQDHSKNPRNVGDLPGATAVVTVTNPVCGDELTLAVRIQNGRVDSAKFRARGCPAAVACSSMLTELIAGLTIVEMRDISAERVAEALGGLPSATRHASQLVEDAL